MKSKLPNQQVPARFDRDTHFQLEPRFESAPADSAQRRFEQLKARLLNPVLHDALCPALRKQLSLAANEAAAVAWTTPFPLLVLPVLLQEKAEEAHQYVQRQEQLNRSSRPLAIETA